MSEWMRLETLEPRLLLGGGPLGDAPARTIEFAGRMWTVKASADPVGPGPNRFSDDPASVWVDADGLHLKIRYDSGTWYTAEVYTTTPTGYGTHRFYVDGRPDLLDKNVVLGLFAYEDGGEELDIEFTRWSQNDPGYRGQYVAQPSGTPGNMERFDFTQNGDLTTHYFDWGADAVNFKSFHDHTAEPLTEGHLIHEWTYTGADIPDEAVGLNVHMNLWLNFGLPPSDGQEVEIVITDMDLPNVMPTISTLSAEGEWLITGEAITLTAQDVVDEDGTVAKVEFFRDDDGDGVGQPGEKLGEDTDGGDGWTWAGQADWPAGTYDILARATDDDGAMSPWVQTAVVVAAAPDITVVIGDAPGAQAKTVTYIDPDGTTATVTLRRGAATLQFARHDPDVIDGDGGLLIAGGGVTLTHVALASTTAGSQFTVKARGGADRRVEVGRITGETPIGKLDAAPVDLVGAGLRLTGDGYVRTLTLHDLLYGADVITEGDPGRRGVSVKIGAVSAGSVIDLAHGPIRRATFTGEFRGVFTAGVDAGADGAWFTDDDVVDDVVRVHSLRLARGAAGDAAAGDPYGLLLGPDTRKVVTGLSDPANRGASVDGAGFEARVLPAADAAVTIRRATGRTNSRTVLGQATGAPGGFFKVVLYAKTDHWYIQPFLGDTLAISASGRWRARKVHAGDLYAYLVRVDYSPANQLFVPLTLDGNVILAVDVLPVA